MFKVIKQNKLIIVLLMAVFMVGGTLMVVSQNVYEHESSVSKKSRALVEQEWELRTLKAEWAYLSRPDRIDELSSAMDGGVTSAIIVAMQPHDDDVDIQPVASIIPTPLNKPFYRVRAVAAPTHVPVATPVKSDPQTNDFSSLLKTIGGTP